MRQRVVMSNGTEGAWPDVRRTNRLLPVVTAGVAVTSVVAMATAAARGSSALGALSAGLLVPIALALLVAVGLGAAFAGVTAWAATSAQGRRELAMGAVGLVATVAIVALVSTVLPGISTPRPPRVDAGTTSAGAQLPSDVRVGGVAITRTAPPTAPRPPADRQAQRPTPRRTPSRGTGATVIAPPRTAAPLNPAAGPEARRPGPAAPDAPTAPPAAPAAPTEPEPAPRPVLPAPGRLGQPTVGSPVDQPAPQTGPDDDDEPARANKLRRTHRHGPKLRGHQHPPKARR